MTHPEDIERVLTLYKEAISKLNSIAEYRLACNFCLEAGDLLEEYDGLAALHFYLDVIDYEIPGITRDIFYQKLKNMYQELISKAARERDYKLAVELCKDMDNALDIDGNDTENYGKNHKFYFEKILYEEKERISIFFNMIQENRFSEAVIFYNWIVDFGFIKIDISKLNSNQRRHLLEEFKKENAIICCKDEVYHQDDCVSIPGDISHMYSFSKLLGGQYERSPTHDDLCSNDLGNLREWNESFCCISKSSSSSGGINYDYTRDECITLPGDSVHTVSVLYNEYQNIYIGASENFCDYLKKESQDKSDSNDIEVDEGFTKERFKLKNKKLSDINKSCSNNADASNTKKYDGNKTNNHSSGEQMKMDFLQSEGELSPLSLDQNIPDLSLFQKYTFPCTNGLPVY